MSGCKFLAMDISGWKFERVSGHGFRHETVNQKIYVGFGTSIYLVHVSVGPLSFAWQRKPVKRMGDR